MGPRSEFPRVASETLTQDMEKVFQGLQKLGRRVLNGLAERMKGEVFWPCESPAGDTESYLFPWRHTALIPNQSSKLLCPVAGKIRGFAARDVARSMGVPDAPNPEVLFQFLPDTEASKACALCEELASQVSAHPELLGRRTAFVPTKSLKVLPAVDVCIDDAPWSRGGEVELLHGGVSEQAGRSLGCTSLRAKLAECCEAGQLESDGFGTLALCFRH